MITRWYIPGRIKFSCNLLVRALKNVGTAPLRFKFDTPRRRRRWFRDDAEKYVDSSRAMWNLPSPRLPRLFTPFASARDTSLFRRISLRSDFASEALARVESCRCAHINANVIHRRGIRPDSKKFYKFWVGCNPSHGIARGSMICEDWSAPTFRDGSIWL